MARLQRIGIKQFLLARTGEEIAGHADALARADAQHIKNCRIIYALETNGIKTRTESSLTNSVYSLDVITGEAEIIESFRRINILPEVQIQRTRAMKNELACFLYKNKSNNFKSIVLSAKQVKLEDYREEHMRLGRAISKMNGKNGILWKAGVEVLFRVIEAKFKRLKNGSIRVNVHCHLLVSMKRQKNYKKFLADLRDSANKFGLKKYCHIDSIESEDKSIEQSVNYLFAPDKDEDNAELTDAEIVEYYHQRKGIKCFSRLGAFKTFAAGLKPVTEVLSLPVYDYFAEKQRILTKNIVTRHGHRIVRQKSGEYCLVPRGVRTMAIFKGSLWDEREVGGLRPEKLVAIAPPSPTRTSCFARPKIIVLNYRDNFANLVEKTRMGDFVKAARMKWNDVRPNQAVPIDPISAKQINSTQLAPSFSSNPSPFRPNHSCAQFEKRQRFHIRGLFGDLKAQRQSLAAWIKDFEAAGRDAQNKMESLGALWQDGLRTGGHGGLTIAMQAFLDINKLATAIARIAAQGDLFLNGRDFWQGGQRPRNARKNSEDLLL